MTHLFLKYFEVQFSDLTAVPVILIYQTLAIPSEIYFSEKKSDQNPLYWPSMFMHARNLTLVYSGSQCAYTQQCSGRDTWIYSQNKSNKAEQRCVNINIFHFISHMTIKTTMYKDTNREKVCKSTNSAEIIIEWVI